MTDDTTKEAAAAQNEKPGKPRVTFKSLEFKSGLKINLKPNSVVVFVGGNSVGKTQTLRELAKAVEEKAETKVLLDPHEELKRENINIDSVFALVEKSPNTLRDGNFIKISRGENRGSWPLASAQLKQQIGLTLDNNNLAWLGPFFYENIKTENRFKDSSVTNYDDPQHEPPDNPMRLASKSSDIEERVREYFLRVFSKYLFLGGRNGSKVSFLVGDGDPFLEFKKPDGSKMSDGEWYNSTVFWGEVYKKTTPLDSQGDGMRAFVSVMLGVFANAELKSVLLLDEPEAFLHPPQAREVGRILAEDHPQDAQLFIATHSVDVIQGLLDGKKEDDFHIIRLASLEKGTEAYELNNDIVTFITERAFFRYSKLLSALFYKRVIICEAESDCLFYRLMLSNVLSDPAEVSDILFLSAGGKDKVYQFYGILKSLHIPTDVIVDFDILNNGAERLEDTIRILGNRKFDCQGMKVTGGEELWEEFEPRWKTIKSNIEGKENLKSAEKVMQEIQNLFKKVTDKKASFPTDTAKTIKACLKKSSAWEMAKELGESVLKGEGLTAWKELKKLCSENHLWIVPVGEMEGFYREIRGHGNAWLAELLSRVSDGQIDLKTNEDLEKAREFMRAIWNQNWEGV